MKSYYKKIFFRFWLVPLTLIFMFCSSCGFQGRKYTTGHYWDGRNQLDYDTQNDTQNEKQNGNENEEFKKYENKNEKEKTNEHIKNIAVSKQFFETSENIKSNSKHNYSEVADTIDPAEIPIQENSQKLNVDITPHEIDAQKKALDEQILDTIALSALLGGLLFFSLIVVLLQIPDLTPFSTILLIAADVIWYKFTIKLNHSCKKLAHDLKPYESENSNKKWYRKIMSSMDSDWFIRIALILGYLIFNYLIVSLIIQYS